MADGARVDSLDGVRTVAIAAVMLVHAGVPGFGSGWLGVDLFFALSGFLITTLLLQEQQLSGGVSYRAFLCRRALRLMPAYLMYVSLMTYGIWGWPGSERFEHGGWTPVAFTASLWGYFSNFAPMGGIWNGQGVTLHLWSLAVEQQYYLVWPLVFIALMSRPRWLLAIGVVLSLVTAAAFVMAPAGLVKSTYPFTRGFTLMLSSTVAIAAYQARERVDAWRWVGLPGAVVVICAFALAGPWGEEKVRAVLLPPLSVAFAVWTAQLWYRPVPKFLAPILLNRAVQYIGRVSYGVYLYHELVRVAVWYYGKPLMAGIPASLGFGLRLVIYFALTIALAGLSYEFVEKPFLRLSSRFRVRRKADTSAAAPTAGHGTGSDPAPGPYSPTTTNIS